MAEYQPDGYRWQIYDPIGDVSTVHDSAVEFAAEMLDMVRRAPDYTDVSVRVQRWKAEAPAGPVPDLGAVEDVALSVQRLNVRNGVVDTDQDAAAELAGSLLDSNPLLASAAALYRDDAISEPAFDALVATAVDAVE